MTYTSRVAINATNKVVNTVFDTWVVPKIKTFHAEIKQIFNMNFKEYLNRMYNDSSYMNSLIFGKIPKKIEDLYIPLSLSSDFDKESIRIDYPLSIKNLIEQYNKIFIVDTAGMGKSTVLKWMFKKCVELNEGIPIFIDLRKLNKENSIVNEINKGISGINNTIDIDNRFLERFMLEGNFIFFLDGFDEISADQVSYVTDDLQNFISKAYLNKFIITSRPSEELISFNNFYTFHIEKLELEQAESLLRKYAFADKTVENTEDLIKELERRYYKLQDFIETPLMVALLYKGYDYRRNIPMKKSLFYRQVYDALFQDHDMSKSGAFSREKQSNLDIEDFHTLINSLGYITFKLGVLGFHKEDLIKYIEQALKLSEIDAPVLGVIEDLKDNVSLMHLDGNEYVWNHKSLQEYFAAKFICLDIPEHQEEILLKIYDTREFEKYDTLLSLCLEIKPLLFKKTITKKFLEEIISFHESFDEPYNDVKDYRKLLRKLVFNNEYILAVLKKDLIRRHFDEEWESATDFITDGEDKELSKYRHFGFYFLLDYIAANKEYSPTQISATITEHSDYIVVLAKQDKELKPIINILKTNDEDFILRDLNNLNIPNSNLNSIINRLDEDEEQVWIEVFSDDIDEEVFEEESVKNIISLIYSHTKVLVTLLDYEKAKIAFEKIDERVIPKGIFDF